MTTERIKYRQRISKNMRRWTPAKLEKEDVFSRGDEGGWEAVEWRAAITAELNRRK